MQPVNQSVWFYTLHKCASSIVSRGLLRRAKGLDYIDYEACINRGEIKRHDVGQITFCDSGKLYAPIRLSGNPNSPAMQALFQSTTEDFVKNRRSIFMIRDPRDVLVSQFLSFTGAHTLSQVPEVAAEQEAHRNSLKSMGINEFVIRYAELTKAHYLHIHKLQEACQERVVLSYEQMIYDYQRFIQDLCTFVNIPLPVQAMGYLLTRPRKKEQQLSHKRSGVVGQYRTKLAPETIRTLTSILGEALDAHGYNHG